MKKLISSVVALSLLSALLTGCNVVTNTPSSTVSTQTSESSQPAEPLEGASIVLRMSHGDNDTSMLENTWNAYARVFKKSLELYSGGEMTVEIFPNDQLGGTTSCLEQCSQGTLDIALSASVGALSGWIPNACIFDIPYLIDDIDVCNLVCDGEILQELSAELQAAANMRLLTMVQTDFRNVDTWKAPVYSIDDMAGLKTRVQELDPHIAMVESWGAIPTSVAFTELYSAASTGVIVCFENCNYTLFMNNLYETVNYITDTQHAANVCVCVMNEDSWNSLTEDQQAIIERAARDGKRATMGVVTANNVNIINRLEESGVEMISLTDEERQAFKDACSEQVQKIIDSTIDSDFYEQFMRAYADAENILGRN